MNVTSYSIYRVVTEDVSNAWNQTVHKADTIVQCVKDLGNMWLAKEVGTNVVARMLPKDSCRELTAREKLALKSLKEAGHASHFQTG